GAMKDRIFVVLPPGELSAPGEGVTSLGPAPVVENLLGGPVETDLGIAADIRSAVGHGYGNVVRSGVDVEPEVIDVLIEIADGLAHLMHAAKLRMRDQPRPEHPIVRQRGVARLLRTLHAAGVNIVRRRVVRIALIVCKDAKQQRVLVAMYIVQASDILPAV